MIEVTMSGREKEGERDIQKDRWKERKEREREEKERER